MKVFSCTVRQIETTPEELLTLLMTRKYRDGNIDRPNTVSEILDLYRNENAREFADCLRAAR